MKLVRIKQPLVCGSLSHGSIIMPSSCGTSGKRLLLQFSQRANGEAHELIRGRKVSNRNASPKKNLKNFFNLEGFFSFIQYLY